MPCQRILEVLDVTAKIVGAITCNDNRYMQLEEITEILMVDGSIYGGENVR